MRGRKGFARIAIEEGIDGIIPVYYFGKSEKEKEGERARGTTLSACRRRQLRLLISHTHPVHALPPCSWTHKQHHAHTKYHARPPSPPFLHAAPPGQSQVLSFGPSWLQGASRKLRASIGIMYGVLGLPIPRPAPIYMVSGKPVPVPRGVDKADKPAFDAAVDKLLEVCVW